jgi:hypothetical protein
MCSSIQHHKVLVARVRLAVDLETSSSTAIHVRWFLCEECVAAGLVSNVQKAGSAAHVSGNLAYQLPAAAHLADGNVWGTSHAAQQSKYNMR